MELSPLTSETYDDVRDLLTRSFEPISDERWARKTRHARYRLAAGRDLAGRENGRAVATSALWDMDQWWGGRPVSMGGVAAVAVAPEARGRGLGKRLMAAVLEQCVDLGHAVSALFPATTPLYRALGWEHAGSDDWAEFPAEALRGLGGGAAVDVRPIGPEDVEEALAVLRAVYRDNRLLGAVDRKADGLRFYLDVPGEYHYLAPDGLLTYRWAGEERLEVVRLLAGSEATLRALWALVGSGSSTARTVRARLGAHDPLLWALRERHPVTVQRDPWMLRLVDAPAAVAARGYPNGVTAEVPLRVEDPHLPANTGSWTLSVAGGEGRLERSPERPGAAEVGPNGLAALYAGVPEGTLRRAGLLRGGPLGALGAAFAGQAISLEHF
ncbi:GNAT family N-acetyltransferase [Actinomadura parmotrematis]|uniref:GNAT family N-acetyltransferase n=1 Tax=Actinomadura parmotrematis TaxID=2864039 RepID=A0ABS7G1E4_9ACTN|nr:GNAT family N-acetyltransferase [Actinomadura parmotrematis]MBW8486530.1 GNAT family N-acetyltransferase [Actinomadura parmotrematis]